MNKKVSIVIPIYIIDHAFFKMTKDCIDHITTMTDSELIVVDDFSPNQKLVELLKKKCCDSIRWIHNSENRGFAHSVNIGMANSTQDLILLLNNDVTFTKSGWLDKLIAEADRGSDIVSADFGVISERDWHYIPKANRASNRDPIFIYPTAWCVLIKREVIEKEGLFPTNFGRGYWEDTMYSFILSKKGYKMQALVDLGIKHEEHKTFKAIGNNLFDSYNKNREIFIRIKDGKEECILPKISDYLGKENGITRVQC